MNFTTKFLNEYFQNYDNYFTCVLTLTLQHLEMIVTHTFILKMHSYNHVSSSVTSYNYRIMRLPYQAGNFV